jgi:hypothetical protein
MRLEHCPEFCKTNQVLQRHWRCGGNGNKLVSVYWYALQEIPMESQLSERWLARRRRQNSQGDWVKHGKTTTQRRDNHHVRLTWPNHTLEMGAGRQLMHGNEIGTLSQILQNWPSTPKALKMRWWWQQTSSLLLICVSEAPMECRLSKGMSVLNLDRAEIPSAK